MPAPSPERLKAAMINIAYNHRHDPRGVGIRQMTRRLGVNLKVLQPLIDQAVEEGGLFQTHTERQTSLRARGAALDPLQESEAVAELLLDDLRRRAHGDTVSRLAERHSLPRPVVEATLERAVVNRQLCAVPVGALRIYRAS